LVFPSDGAINQPKNLRLQWRLASRATLYQLQVALDPNFAPPFRNVSGITDTSVVVGNLDPFKTYYWRVMASNKGGVSTWSSIWRFTTDNTVGVSERDNAIPTKFSLGQNYPNPFNPSTTIAFSLPRAEHVTLKVFDLLGKEIATLVDKKLSPGHYEARWNAGDVESGTYFYQLRAGEFAATKKLVLMQ
jgi:hypothetical protein